MVSTAPLTPLELRTRRRDAQSLVRRTYNQLNAAIDAWKKASEDGMQASSGASNAFLLQWYLTALPPGVLIQLPDIKEFAAAKLRLQTSAHLAGLQSAVEACTAVTQQLRAASDSLAAGCDGTINGQAVFAALPMPLIAQEVDKVLTAHEAELQLRLEILSDLRSYTGASVKPTVKGSAPDQDRRRRAHMQVLVTAWMLQPMLNEGIVRSTMEMLEAEMKGF